MHLYLHVPYCAAKCPYCDFNSIAGRAQEHSAYVDALLDEVALLPPGPYDTIFLGGGTPTVLGTKLLARLLAGIRARVGLAPDYEWTCEANPSSSDAERYALLAEHGVNRLSLGVQAVQDQHLRFLGRVHDAAQAERALAHATAVFARVSADCIVGLPNQRLDEIDHTIALFARHGLHHASVYHLAIEPGSKFADLQKQGLLRAIDSESSRAVLERVAQGLARLGLDMYETSNFAAPGEVCRHNLAYWRQCDWQAAGAGAVSCVNRERITRHRHPAHYINALRAGDPPWRREYIDERSWLIECWMLGLRLAEGLAIDRLATLGDSEQRWRPIASDLATRGLLSETDGRLALTPDGRLVQDAVTVALMPPPVD